MSLLIPCSPQANTPSPPSAAPIAQSTTAQLLCELSLYISALSYSVTWPRVQYCKHASARKSGLASRLQHYYMPCNSCTFSAILTAETTSVLFAAVDYASCGVLCTVRMPLPCTLLMDGWSSNRCFEELCDTIGGPAKLAYGCSAGIVRSSDGVTVCGWLSCSTICHTAKLIARLTVQADSEMGGQPVAGWAPAVPGWLPDRAGCRQGL